MKIETHKEALAEYLAYIEHAKHAIESSRRLLLLTSSQAAAELVSILLHKLNLLDVSSVVKHTKLDSEKWWAEFPDFAKKSEVQWRASEIERARSMAYGTLKTLTKDQLLGIVSLLFELKALVGEVANEEL